MLRITRLAEDSLHVTMLLEGQVRSQWVYQLDSIVNACVVAQQQVALDFRGVSFVSPAGIELLKRFRDDGVRFVNCPAIVMDLLEGDQSWHDV